MSSSSDITLASSAKTHEATEQQQRIEATMCKILPLGIVRILYENRDLLQTLKDTDQGQHIKIAILTPYAADSISFQPLWKHSGLSEQQKEEIHKRILAEYIRVGGWVSQRDPQKTYMNIWIGTEKHPIPDDEIRTKVYIDFLQNTVPEILKGLNLSTMTVQDCVLLTRGDSIDPKNSTEPPGEIVLIKDPTGKIAAAQTIPPHLKFMAAAILLSDTDQIRRHKKETDLPLVVCGSQYNIHFANKGIDLQIDFIPSQDLTEIQRIIPRKNENRTDSEFLHWCFENLTCDGYFTPKEFLTFLKQNFQDLDIEAKNHQIIDIILQSIRTSLPITITASGSGADLSGMSLITRSIGSDKPKIAQQFQEALHTWQMKAIALYKKNGYSVDEIAGDGMNAYDFRNTQNDQQDILQRIEMAFAVHNLWQEVLSDESNQFSELNMFLTENGIQPHMKTALTAIKEVTVRWYGDAIDIIPSDPVHELLSELKKYQQSLQEPIPCIIVSSELYTKYKNAIDTLYEVIPDTDTKGLLLQKKNKHYTKRSLFLQISAFWRR